MRKTKKVLRKICEIIDEKKGEDILVLDISEVSSFADFFIICHGYNQKQNQAICDGIRETLKKEYRLHTDHVEGYQQADWILMDYLNFVVHIFSPQARQFYKLDRLWSDGVQLEPKALSA